MDVCYLLIPLGQSDGILGQLIYNVGSDVLTVVDKMLVDLSDGGDDALAVIVHIELVQDPP